MAETVVLKVAMSCQGCAGAVQRALTKMEGIDLFNVDLKEQKVTVVGNVKPEDVFQTVSKTGKKTTFWEAESEAKTETAPAATEPKTTVPPATEPKTTVPPATETKIEDPPTVTETKNAATAAPVSANTTENTVAKTADPASTTASS